MGNFHLDRQLAYQDDSLHNDTLSHYLSLSKTVCSSTHKYALSYLCVYFTRFIHKCSTSRPTKSKKGKGKKYCRQWVSFMKQQDGECLFALMLNPYGSHNLCKYRWLPRHAEKHVVCLVVKVKLNLFFTFCIIFHKLLKLIILIIVIIYTNEL